MVVLVTCKNEEDPFKNKGHRVVTIDLYADVSKPSRAVNSTVYLGWLFLKFKLIQAFMYVLVTCKNEKDPIKNEDARVVTTLSIKF